MHSSRRFKAFLGFNWQWYLVILASVIFVFYYVFVTLRTPSYDEKVQVFMAVENIDAERLGEELYVGFDGTKIQEVFIDFSSPNVDDFSLIFNTRGTVNTDIIIMSDTYINQGDYSRFFVGYTHQQLSEYIQGDFDCLYDSDGLIYGVRINDYLKDYVKKEDDLYLYFNKKSEKIGKLGDNCKNDYAIIVLRNIIERSQGDENNN